MNNSEIMIQGYTIPDLVEILNIGPGKIRRLIETKELAAYRGEGNVLYIPKEFIVDNEPLHSLKGTLIVLEDAGFNNDQAIKWLFTLDESLNARPIDALLQGRKSEVRRVALALAY